MKTHIRSYEDIGTKTNQKGIRCSWALAVILGFWAAFAQGEEFRYRYIELSDKVPPPPSNVVESFFDAKTINDRGQVSGDIYNCDEITCEIVVGIYKNGRTQALQPGISGPINIRGNIGGGVIIDADNSFTQAAIFSTKGLELIPPMLGEITSNVIALNDKNAALVDFTDAVGSRFALYSKGKSTVIDFGQRVTTPSLLGLNNKGVISGTSGTLFVNEKAFRFDPRSGFLELLEPLATEPFSRGLGINNQGNVLGYSFIPGSLERVGLWDRFGKFKTYFVEGTPEFPTVSNQLVFNDKNQIVISRIGNPSSERNNVSYLVPKPGVRLNIADLVINLPPERKISIVWDINNHGDMIATDVFFGTFLLQRLEDNEILAPESP